jgi:hypothetical protein
MFARSLFALLTLLMLSSAYADCPMQKTQISGRVESKDQPVPNAEVKVTWDEERVSEVSAATRSNAEGDFELEMSIDTFDGRTLMAREKCGYTPKRVEIRVRHDGYREFSRKFDYADLGEPVLVQLRAR